MAVVADDRLWTGDVSPAARPVTDDRIWTGDERPPKPWHPLHLPAEHPLDDEQRLEVTQAAGFGRAQDDSFLNTLALVAQRSFSAVEETRGANSTGKACSDTLSAAINLIGASEQWTKASAGYDLCSVHRDVSICAHTILKQDDRANSEGCLVVLDAAQDTRFKYSDVCTVGPFQIRFYAGVGIEVRRGGVNWTVGTLCVFDSKPRSNFSFDDCRVLAALGKAVSDYLSTAPPNNWLGAGEHGQCAVTMTSAKQKAEFLKKCMALTVCGTVEDEAMHELAKRLNPVIIEAQEFVCRDGEPCKGIFFVVSGSLECRLRGQVLERLRRGQCLGEIALMKVSNLLAQGIPLDQARHMCVRGNDVVATEASELLALSLDDAWPLLDQMPNLWYILRDMARQRSQRIVRFSPLTPQ